MSDPRLEVLIDRCFDGALAEDERAELERVLLSSPAARETYWAKARLHADVARWGQEAWGRRMAATTDGEAADPPPLSPRTHSAAKTWPSRRWFAGLAAAAACLAIAGVLIVNRSRPPVHADNGRVASTSPATLPSGVAVLASSVDARWDSAVRSGGAVLPPGTSLKLKSGVAQVEFYSGARLVLQGPVEVELRSEMEAHCRAGRVTAQVPPPARGFKLSGDQISVIDLGTEFGLNVPATGPAEVHVFSGQVEVHPVGPAGPVVGLTTGQAGEFPAGAAPRRMPAAPQSFLRAAEYAILADADTGRRRTAWQDAVKRLSADPATIAHYTFPGDQIRSRTVTNLATGANGAFSASPASIVGCAAVDGRWPPARAVEFAGPGDRVRLEVGGSFSAITLLAWVRFDTLPNTYHALLAPDGLAQGTLRWGLTGGGALRLAIARKSGEPDANWEAVISDPVVAAGRLGRWGLLASTFDGKAVRHYLDGRLVKTLDAHSPVPLVIGPAEVGNRRGPTPRFIRGRMDELAILSRAMGDAEVAAIYEAGRPIEAAGDESAAR